MRYPLVRDLAAEGVPVAVTCRVLQFSKRAYFKWLRRPCCRRDLDNAYLINAAVDVNHDDPAFGYRFIADELERQGHRASENRVWRLCSEQRLWSAHSKKRGLHRRPGPPVHDDLVERDFSADRPNELWLTDITEHRTREGKLYCCVGEGRLLEPHRRLCHRRPHDCRPRRQGLAPRRRTSGSGCHGGPQ
jgi:putative transposase